jgi:ubiquinone/menaquinone biosynthesis C-methylase UbiE/uncharacterized protein YbaR (Trm112 family)
LISTFEASYMDYRGIEIVCPVCKEDLREEKEGSHRLSCVACERQFPVVIGIPDLRVHSDPYIDMEGDRAKGVELAKKSVGLNFAEAVDLYYSLASKVPPNQARLFKRGLMAARYRAEESLKRWEAQNSQNGEADRLLEIGCGTAPLLVAAAAHYKRIVGIDIAFRWLVIARKRLEEAGLDIPIICACAEALPFPDAAFDRVVCDSVLEQVRDQQGALAECCRVARPSGRLFVSTPNRFSLGPDPHTGIWAGSYLPNWLIDIYVRRQGGNPPERQLLSAKSLARFIQGAGFDQPLILLPEVPAEQRSQFGKGMRMLIDLYQIARRMPVSRAVLRRIGPLLHAVAEKPAVQSNCSEVKRGQAVASDALSAS